MHGAAIIAVPLLIVLSLLLVGEWRGQAQTAQPCGDERLQELARVQMLDALDTAFQDHVAGLYAVWLREANRSGQQRAAAGVDRGVGAYIHGRHAIEAWRLQRCR